MKKLMTKIKKTMIYFFTPEDSTAPAGLGSLSFDFSRDSLNLGSVKALFWTLGAMGIYCLVTLL